MEEEYELDMEAENLLLEIEKTGLFKYDGNSRDCAISWDESRDLIKNKLRSVRSGIE